MTVVFSRVAIYARVSSKKQADAHTIESQLQVLPQLCAQRGWPVVATFKDDGRTAKAGHLGKREGLARLLDGVQAGAFDLVVVFDLDRLTRSEDLAERGHILGAFQSANVHIAVYTTGQVLDLRTSNGDLLAMLGSFGAADWVRKHKERTKAGKYRAIANNKKPAGPTPYGLHYELKTGVFSFAEGEADVMREAFARVAAGESCESIAVDFEARGIERRKAEGWTRASVYRLVRNSVYRGHWIVDKKLGLALTVPAIVDDETWFAAQAKLQRNRTRGLRRTKHVYLLEGLARCAVCGEKIGINSARQRREGQVAYYLCSSKRRRGGSTCTLPMQRTKMVDAAIWQDLAAALSTPQRLERAIAAHRGGAVDERSDWQSDLRGYEAKLAKLDRADAAILDRFRRGLIADPVMDSHLETSKRERTAIVRQIEASKRAASSSSSTVQRLDGVLASVKMLRSRVADADLAVRRELVVLLLGGDGRTVELAPREVRARVRLSIGHALAAGSSAHHEANDADAVELPLRVVL